MSRLFPSLTLPATSNLYTNRENFVTITCMYYALYRIQIGYIGKDDRGRDHNGTAHTIRMFVERICKEIKYLKENYVYTILKYENTTSPQDRLSFLILGDRLERHTREDFHLQRTILGEHSTNNPFIVHFLFEIENTFLALTNPREEADDAIYKEERDNIASALQGPQETDLMKNVLDELKKPLLPFKDSLAHYKRHLKFHSTARAIIIGLTVGAILFQCNIRFSACVLSSIATTFLFNMFKPTIIDPDFL